MIQSVMGHIDIGTTMNIYAEVIQKAVGCDLFEVDTVKAYAEDYYACIDEAKEELLTNARPELKKSPDNIDGSRKP